ncbi:MAG: SDR family oxidoreductase [Desulfobacterales bacterium]|nr:MAG: SDR family oxidoreductase [Desulfobacterales bacterium]UCD88659.1 MAG: SDR family oxidoreductase [Desulfobacterales bacterium]
MSKKVAVVTAASKGMGAACATELAQREYELVLMSRSDAVLELANKLQGIGLQGDIMNPSDLERVVFSALNRYGRVDAVVNNTGHPAKGDLLGISDQAWHDGLDLVLLNVIRTARHVVPIMEKKDGGCIVNISSFGAREPSLDFPVSSSLRAALSAFTKLFADRYADRGIRMNSVLPGYVDSYPIDSETKTSIPMQRPGSVKEIAKMVAFLLSDDASYITGQSICVDGGLGRSF